MLNLWDIARYAEGFAQDYSAKSAFCKNKLISLDTIFDVFVSIIEIAFAKIVLIHIYSPLLK